MKLFAKLGRSREILTETERDDLARRIGALTEQLEDVRANFDIVTDERAIDALIYEENALICRIESLHREARERGITVHPFER